jgi:hypothetical protein
MREEKERLANQINVQNTSIRDMEGQIRDIEELMHDMES